ncbi:hypothetical protein GE061_014985 [Apolygus lucorum]|uniref:Fibronectin type III domain-containing protein n=1 Tax=Apolygus lucorum TaxID=248454 RepID=A0A8S9XJL3_APOLU|nr:hypothetical protein GE061_014985 [Apolygus lucorum]
MFNCLLFQVFRSGDAPLGEGGPPSNRPQLSPLLAMVVWVMLLVIHGATTVGSMPAGGTPENITVVFLLPDKVKVSWTTADDKVEKYDVMYKPTDARVVRVVTVTAVRGGRKYRSRPVVFRTLEVPKTVVEPTIQITGSPPGKVNKSLIPPHPGLGQQYMKTVTDVRGIEVGLVCLVLLIWVGAIILFFNRWGKIRMLLPYQPDYKDTQLKVPGSCQGGTTTCGGQGGGSSGFCCSQTSSCCLLGHLSPRQLARVPDDWFRGSQRFFIARARSRTNSAVYIEAGRCPGDLTQPLFAECQLIANNKSKSADHLPEGTVDIKCFQRNS